MDSLLVLAIAIIVLWALSFGYYFFVVRQQSDLENEIDSVRSLLNEQEKEERQ